MGGGGWGGWGGGVGEVGVGRGCECAKCVMTRGCECKGRCKGGLRGWVRDDVKRYLLLHGNVGGCKRGFERVKCYGLTWSTHCCMPSTRIRMYLASTYECMCVSVLGWIRVCEG